MTHTAAVAAGGWPGAVGVVHWASDVMQGLRAPLARGKGFEFGFLYCMGLVWRFGRLFSGQPTPGKAGIGYGWVGSLEFGDGSGSGVPGFSPFVV